MISPTIKLFRNISVVASLVSVVAPHLAWAGHAQGNGGLIHRDQQNPWFLENTSLVRYCIDLDATNFGVSAEIAAEHVRDALRDWKNVFKLAHDDYYDDGVLQPFGQVRVATQTFEEHACSEPIEFDLRFQLGRLTDDQQKLFSDPKEYVGIAVRTDYQQETMKGRGFVYLSPVSGPLAPDHDRMHDKAWSEQQHFAFKIVLRHELGHVFGIDHQPNSVMDDKWPELFVDREFLRDLTPSEHRYFEQKTDLMRLYGFKRQWYVEECGVRNPVFFPAIFGKVHSERACGRVSLNNNQMIIQYKTSPDDAFEVVAEARIVNFHANSTPSISVFLPKEQKVFTALPPEASRLNRLFGETKNSGQKWDGELQIKATGEALPLQIEANLNQSSGTVLKEGRFENDIFFLE